MWPKLDILAAIDQLCDGCGHFDKSDSKMLRKSNLVTAILLACAPLLVGSGAALSMNAETSEKRCTTRTARQASSPLELCGCTTVTTGMVSYIQRSRDFSDILLETSRVCPPLAAILSDLPTAAIGDDGDEPAGPDVGGPEGGSNPEPEDIGCGGSCPGFD